MYTHIQFSNTIFAHAVHSEAEEVSKKEYNLYSFILVVEQ